MEVKSAGGRKVKSCHKAGMGKALNFLMRNLSLIGTEAPWKE